MRGHGGERSVGVHVSLNLHLCGDNTVMLKRIERRERESGVTWLEGAVEDAFEL